MGIGGGEALTAESEQRDMAWIRAEAVAFEQAMLQRREQGRVHLADRSAPLADEVMMRRLADQLELSRTGAKIGLRNEADRDQEVERAVDRRQIQRWVARRRPLQDRVRADMPAQRRERLQNEQPLRGDAHAQPTQPRDVIRLTGSRIAPARARSSSRRGCMRCRRYRLLWHGVLLHEMGSWLRAPRGGGTWSLICA